MTTEGQRVMDPMRVKRLNEASDWLLLLESTGRTEEDTNEWLRWCDADSRNVAAFEHLQRHWRDLDALKGGARDYVLTPEQKTGPIAPETGHRFSKVMTLVLPLRTRLLQVLSKEGKNISPLRFCAVAASLAAIVVAAGSITLRLKPAAIVSPPQQVASTGINRAATLPDGSKLILGAKTLVNVDFSGKQRTLELSAGEAYFKVKHDKRHPFIVHAGEVSVTAIGTAFDVRRLNDKVTVTVEEGTVEVTRSAASNHGEPTTWRAEAGCQVTYSSDNGTASIASIDPSRALAWRSGELAYVRESLGSVIEDLNRYSARKIVIQDPAIADLRFTGTAFVSSLDDWLQGVEQAYPVSARATATGDIILTEKR